MKARKNAVELANLRQAMIRDGRGMVRFLAWLDQRSAAQKSPPLDEESAARRLQAIRREDERYVSDSFNYISGWGPNGAVVHYAHDPSHPAVFGDRGLYLIDSGGQYRDGTTDITRTIAVGTPSEQEKGRLHAGTQRAHRSGTASFPGRNRGTRYRRCRPRASVESPSQLRDTAPVTASGSS
jgi:Xaa-Pro aminopeptidase